MASANAEAFLFEVERMSDIASWSAQPSVTVTGVGCEINSIALRYFKKGIPIEQAMVVARAERDRYAKEFNVLLPDEDLGKAVCLAYGTDPAALKLDFSDGVLAQSFVATNPDLKFVVESDTWYGFENGVWVPSIDPRQQVAKFLHEQEPQNLSNPKAQQNIHKELYSTKKLAAVLFQVKYHPALLVSETDFDRDPMLLGLPKGECLDLRDGGIRKATREDLISKVMPCAPAPEGAKHERWESFQQETHTDPDVIRFLQEWFGACLTADTSMDMLLFLIGHAGAGKGTTIKPLQTLLGPYSLAASKTLLLQSSDEARRDNYLAQLCGKRLAVCSEGDKIKKLDVTTLKLLTGGDFIQGRRLGRDPINFAPTHKVCILANSEPPMDDDDGIRRRVVVIPFRNVPNLKDETLRDYFCSSEVLPFIFRWAIEGCLRWQSSGKKLLIPDSVKTRTAEYLVNMDMLGRFLDERIEEALGHALPTSQLYAAWCGYCELERQDLRGSFRSFVSDIERRKPQWVSPGDNRRSINGVQQRCFVGIKLLDDRFAGRAI
jgi:P4 family phage/plasmid primase-like protien